MLVVAWTLAGSAVAADKPWKGLGRPAKPVEIAAWDIDVKPDGSGLPKGRGTVEQGQEIYDAKCGSCHGTFGESNQYLQLAGGVGSLATDNPVRTTGSKLNYATTLWDYINRAMPFQAPKSLSPDEVYALTAYLLHLNELLPAEAALDEKSILAVKLPNRDGFIMDHGFMRKDGKPDVRNTSCVQDCESEVKIVSAIPDHARNAHGNLAEQFRPLGPYRGADTSRPAPQARLAAAKLARAEPHLPRAQKPAADLARQYACTACHGLEHKVVGPGFKEVASKYVGQAGARDKLIAKVRHGGAGTWGSIPMPAQPQVAEDDLAVLIDWVLAGAK